MPASVTAGGVTLFGCSSVRPILLNMPAPGELPGYLDSQMNLFDSGGQKPKVKIAVSIFVNTISQEHLEGTGTDVYTVLWALTDMHVNRKLTDNENIHLQCTF